MNTSPIRIQVQMPNRRERGVVLLFALIALLILMIGAVALVRSLNSSMLNTGSVAFKRDLVNRNEAAVARVLNLARQPNNLTNSQNAAAAFPSMNYSPQILGYNDQGIPLVLLMNDTDFDASGFARSSNDIQLAGDGITLRFVIDRQCDAPGDVATIGASHCATSSSSILGGSSDVPIRAENSALGRAGGLSISPVYRLTIRALGPKGAMSFYQTTFTLL